MESEPGEIINVQLRHATRLLNCKYTNHPFSGVIHRGHYH